MSSLQTTEHQRKHLLDQRERDRPHRDRVLSFREWCAVNSFSTATGRRLIKAGLGPPVLQLSPRRLGVRESDNAAWQQSRVRKD
jgi:predicted DNA-binding transcriptional regulator AlpA